MSPAGARLGFQEIRYRIQSHAVLRLLRKDRAAFILTFLISAFNSRQRSDIPESELLSELSAFSDILRLAAGDRVAPSTSLRRRAVRWPLGIHAQPWGAYDRRQGRAQRCGIGPYGRRKRGKKDSHRHRVDLNCGFTACAGEELQ
jgi:hypothetical protein